MSSLAQEGSWPLLDHSLLTVNLLQYGEQQSCLSVGHFHKDCFVVLEILELNL